MIRRMTLGLLLVTLASPASADDATPSAAAKDLAKLLAEYNESRSTRTFVPRFFEFAKQYADTPEAVDALTWIVGKRRYKQEGVEAIELLQKHHLKSPRLAESAPRVARTMSAAAERLLLAAAEKNPHTEVQAQALFYLTQLLEAQTRIAEQLQADPAQQRRAAQYYGKELAEHLSTLKFDAVAARREVLYERMKKSFADVEVGGQELGPLADRTLFAIRHLSVGKAAPEIDAEDIQGKRFKLSDYRGKVVLLSFWGHW